MSKELEALETLVYGLTNDNYKKEDLGITMSKCREIIKTALKALEIIKEKRVNVGDFVRCRNVKDYNEYCCYNEKEKLTKEEFELLKEILG